MTGAEECFIALMNRMKLIMSVPFFRAAPAEMYRLTKLGLSRSQKIAQNCHTGGARCAQKRMKVLPEWIIWRTGWKKKAFKSGQISPQKMPDFDAENFPFGGP